jgi:hypothetical protein
MRRVQARETLAAYPLTAEECKLLRVSPENLRANVGVLMEMKTLRWLLGWRDICRSTDERTGNAFAMTAVGVGHTSPLMFYSTANLIFASCLQANLTSFVLDYCARQKIGGTHLTYGFLNQLPVLPPVRAGVDLYGV